MRVLNVNHTLDPVHGGGTAERTFQMSRFLARSGVACTVLTTEAGLTPARAAALHDVRVVSLPLLSARFFLPRVSRPRLDDLVSSVDIIHLMGHWSPLNALVHRAAQRAGKPYVVCPAGALPIYGRSRLLKRAYNLFAGKRIVRDASACIAITADEIEHFKAYGVAPEQVHVIPNGVDAEDYAHGDPAAFRARFGLGDHPFILFVGRLNPIKGPDLLLDAYCAVSSNFPDWHLVYAGPDGGMLAGLQDRVRAGNLTARVHFIGYIGGAQKAAAYHAADLLAIPSRQEAMSIVVLEAGITDTPVLLTDQCGLNVVGSYGGTVVPATAAGIGRGLTELLADRSALGARGAALGGYTRGHYLWHAIVGSYVALYEQLLRVPAR